MYSDTTARTHLDRQSLEQVKKYSQETQRGQKQTQKPSKIKLKLETTRLHTPFTLTIEESKLKVIAVEKNRHIKEGAIISEVNGEPIRSLEQLSAITQKNKGSKISIRYLEEGKYQKKNFKLL